MNEEVNNEGIVVPLPLGKQVNLTEIIKDRKPERKLKAEEKRQEDLQRIRNMKSKTGIDPLERFPKEIWAMILGELNPIDRGNACSVHPLFQDLMKTSRVRDILLPQVLRLKAFQEHCREEGIKLYWNERRISKSTRSYFDLCEKEKVIKEVNLAVGATSFYPLCPHLNLDSASRQMLSRLLTSFGGSENPGKSFFPQALTVSFSELDLEIEDEEELRLLISRFKSDVSSLLELIGDQILHFRFFMMDPDCPFSEISNLFQWWCSLVKNVQWLEFCIGSSDPQEAVKVAFSHLPSLQRLTLHFCGHPVRMEIYEAVIASNQHVKTLDFVNPTEDDMTRFTGRSGGNLIQSLELTSIFVNIQSSRGLKLETFQSIVNFNWKLKAIILQLDMNDVGLGMSTVFQFLERFPTLETVRLKGIYNLRIEETDSWGYLRLPNLKHLQMNLQDPDIDYGTNIHFFLSLQFLLNCGKLAKLNWSIHGVEDYELRQVLKMFESRDRNTIDFRAGLRFLYESNIWDVFPFLDNVSVGIHKSQRDEATGEVEHLPCCGHSYRRGDKKEKVSQFLMKHSCSLLRDGLKNCVVFAE